MYGNVDPGQGKVWVPGPDQDLCPPEENPYEPLDPPSAPSSQKNVPTSPPGAPRPCPLRGSGVSLGSPRATHGWCPRGRWVLVALGVSVLLNVLLIAFGARHVSALTAALDAEKEKSLPPPTASSSFLLYNAHHARCVVATGHLLGATPCQPRSPSQRFQWLPGGRLLHSGSGLCVTATSARNLALVRLSRCQEGARLQRWQCQPGALLALQGQALHFNYGNNAQGEGALPAPRAGCFPGIPVISSPNPSPLGLRPKNSALPSELLCWNWRIPRKRSKSRPCSKAQPGSGSGMRSRRAPGKGATAPWWDLRAVGGTDRSPTGARWKIVPWWDRTGTGSTFPVPGTSAGSVRGIPENSREFCGNSMGIPWEFHQDSLRIV
ncbi:uncharacterized protein [Pithys albifrons albifrons]|uniref:uncharacterized protein isoform X2 n=1 Tax=Pithys albifrons albifrons TaxID=3385563 RepID=UPI003A5CD2D3